MSQEREPSRTVRDTMGEVQVPVSALYGAATQRAVENFPISGQHLDPAIITALVEVKRAAAAANAELGILDPEVASAICAACEEVLQGAHSDQFPIDVYQTGSGTSSNMNVNEVLATLATNRTGHVVHPNDQVNASQSSNDVFPTALHLAAATRLQTDLLPALRALVTALADREREFAEVIKAGRTHLMDATPVTLGQEFGGYAAMVDHAIDRLHQQMPRLCQVPLGGTAVGTGLNAPPGFAALATKSLAQRTGLPVREAANHFEAQGARDGLVELSGSLRNLAVSLTKICNDLRWLASGPNAGLAEINLPDLQPGSSIMPGKVNPVLPEAVLMVCARVVGNDATVAWAGASGAFELNVQMPVLGQALLESLRLLANSTRLLAEGAILGITANRERALAYAQASPAIVTPLNRLIGYDAAARVAKDAVSRGITIRQAALDLGLVSSASAASLEQASRAKVTQAQLDEALDVRRMLGGTR